VQTPLAVKRIHSNIPPSSPFPLSLSRLRFTLLRAESAKNTRLRD
jgi:hypothetical protein